MHVLCGNTGYILEAGDLALLHPGQKNCLLYLPGRVCRKYGVILNGRIMEETLRLLHLDQVNCIHLPDSKRLVEILARLKRELRRPVSLKTCECVSGITFELLNWVANANAPCHRIRESCEIQACLDQRINEKISIRQIAAEFKMSLPTFNLRFQNDSLPISAETADDSSRSTAGGHLAQHQGNYGTDRFSESTVFFRRIPAVLRAFPFRIPETEFLTFPLYQTRHSAGWNCYYDFMRMLSVDYKKK